MGIKKRISNSDIIDVFQSENITYIKRLLIHLNANWSEYVRFLDLDDFNESTLIPIRKYLFPPSSLFVESRRNKYILGNTVHYAPKYLSNKRFVKDLKINNKTIPEEFLFEVLRNTKKVNKSKIDKKHLATVYSRFRNTSDIQEIFTE